MLKEFAFEIGLILFFLFLFIAGSNSTILKSQTLNPSHLFSESSVTAQQFYNNVFNIHVYNLYKNLLYFLAIFFITIIAYCLVRLLEIRKKEHDHLHHEIHEYAHNQAKEHESHAEKNVSMNSGWNKVLTYLSSASSSDWKLAIIEADTMLDQLLSDLGFRGATLGDRLKMASQETFKGLTHAWEVHNIRNRIAHEGLNFELSKHEANRVIALYESIFREYGFI